MGKYFILYNNETNLDIDLLIRDRPSKPSPEMEYEEVKVPGGKTLYREKGYKDIDIPISFNFLSKKSFEWDKDFRRVKKWLLSKVDNRLKFADDFEVYYKVNKVTIDTPERILKKLGRFDVTFTCEPYVYIDNDEIELNTVLYNDYLVSKPIYRVVGEGNLTLNINNKVIKANVGQELIIDTDKGLCYREDIVNNIALEGKYEDLYLQEGYNNFSWTDGFEIYITPNLRCL
nr:MAG TPA: distal tail protein [Caudoviricetes sp.]